MTGRGFNAEQVKRWMLGFVAQPAPGHERFAGQLCIPYPTSLGMVSQKFRCLQQHSCKELGHERYGSEAGSGTYLFGVMQLHRSVPTMYVTEGELDCVAAFELAGLPAVGVSGTNKWRDHWVYHFERFPEVVVLADGDDKGQVLARNVTSNVHHARVVTMPAGHDVNSFVVEFGAQALRERVGVK